MNKSGFAFTVAAFFMLTIVLPFAFANAQGMGPSNARAKEAFKAVLSSADINKDGKLSLEECYAIWKDRKIAEKNCKYWDANGDGSISEDEYAKQSRKIMK